MQLKFLKTTGQLMSQKRAKDLNQLNERGDFYNVFLNLKLNFLCALSRLFFKKV